MKRLPISLRLGLFQALEWVAATRQHLKREALPAAERPPAQSKRSLWVFVSTIGELNAIEPFLRRLLDELGHPPLTLITDRSNYGEAYLAKYPDAHVAQLIGGTREAQQLARLNPPLMLVVAEIPCMLHDAPCRFSFATLRAAHRAGAPTVLVNGWLYGYTPPSRMDQIESELFAVDYLREFDLMMVQTEEIRQRLLAAGAAPERLAVTGNIKFDSMNPAFDPPRGTSLRAALAARSPGPIVVAGSVTENADQAGILDAFIVVLKRFPEALLVLAPRHPENLKMMSALERLLQERGLGFRHRSQHDVADAVASQVMVLDTMGELRGCYAACSVAFVGKDHSVLEPLAFSKPVTVGPDWVSTYPSYPVYRQLLDAGVLVAVASMADLGKSWTALLDSTSQTAASRHQLADAVLAAARGASERSLIALQKSGLLSRFSGSLPPSLQN